LSRADADLVSLSSPGDDQGLDKGARQSGRFIDEEHGDERHTAAATL